MTFRAARVLLLLVGSAAAPAAAQMPPVPLRAITVRVAADEAVRAQPDWEATLRRTVQAVSALYEKAFQLRWTILEIVPWTPAAGPGDRARLLKSLKTDVGRGAADIVIGFSALTCTPASAAISHPFGGEALVMAACGHPAPSSTAEQQLSHELAHLLGAFHIGGTTRSVMQGGAAGDFDAQSARAIRLLRGFDFAAGVAGLDETTRRAWMRIYAEGRLVGEPNAIAAAFRRQGIELMEAGKLDEAITQITEATRADPTDARAASELGDLLARKGKTEEAVTTYRRAVKADPRYAPAHAALGALLERVGRNTEATAAFREGVRLEPDSAAAHLRLGMLYLRGKQPNEAVEELRAAVGLAPDVAAPRVDLGTGLAMQGKLDEALAEMKKASELDPALATPHSVRGLVLAQQKKLPEAVEALREAVRLDPDAPRYRAELAGLLMQQNKPGDAIAEMREAVRLAPTLEGSHLMLGRTLAQRGKIEEAVTELREAIRLNPASPARYFLAEAFFGAKRYRDAWGEVEAAAGVGLGMPPEFMKKLTARMPDPRKKPP